MILKASAEKGSVRGLRVTRRYPVHALHFPAQWRRQVIHHRIEQRLHALFLKAPTTTGNTFRDGDLREARSRRENTFEEPVQHFVIVFCDGLDQRGMESFGFSKFGGIAPVTHHADGVVLPDNRLHLMRSTTPLNLFSCPTI
jgi:hypothetical protein